MRNLPPVLKNILTINIIVFVATLMAQSRGSYIMDRLFAFYAPSSPYFRIWQPVTYMFMHGGWLHIFFNMYTLVIFGGIVERMIGSRKFLIFYLLCGLGAAGLHYLVTSLIGGSLVPMVGASGAVYGVLVAYAMLFPDSRMTLIFPPVTLSAKWMVLVFVGIEMLTGVTGSMEGVAHFAHLGGMLAGYLLILYWKKRGTLFDREDFRWN